jgi:hypothetical protein
MSSIQSKTEANLPPGAKITVAALGGLYGKKRMGM